MIDPYNKIYENDFNPFSITGQFRDNVSFPL